jgi:hypothetical protein
MTARCIGEPVSWLLLERFRLGELGEPERARIAEHVAACAACAACTARIEADEGLELPPLEVGAAGKRRHGAVPASPRRVRWLASVGAIAAAAATVLVLGRTWRAPGGAAVDSGERARPKGDAMAFVLVRDDGQRMVDAQGVFRNGDRFKALITCPPSTTATFDLVVFDASGASFPLAQARGLTCGNEVPLPGAFRLTADGGSETVCIVWGDGGEVDRTALSQSGVAGGPHSMCKELRAAGD